MIDKKLLKVLWGLLFKCQLLNIVTVMMSSQTIFILI